MTVWDSIAKQLPHLKPHFYIMTVLSLTLLLAFLIAVPFMKISGFAAISRETSYWKWRFSYRKTDRSFYCRRWFVKFLAKLPLPLRRVRNLFYRFEDPVEWFLYKLLLTNLPELYRFHLYLHMLLTLLTAGFLIGFSFSWAQELASTPHVVWNFSSPYNAAKTFDMIKNWEHFCFWPTNETWFHGRGQIKYVFKNNWNYFYRLTKVGKKRGWRLFLKHYWLQAEPFIHLHWKGRNSKRELFTGFKKRKSKRSTFILGPSTSLKFEGMPILARFRLQKAAIYFLTFFLVFQIFGFYYGYAGYTKSLKAHAFDWFSSSPRQRRVNSRHLVIETGAYQDKIRKMNYIGVLLVVPFLVFFFFFYIPSYTLPPA